MMKTQSWKHSTIRFLSAQTISLFGSSLVQYAIIWYITLSTSSGKMLTISTLCGFLPQIIISLFAGVWIDKYDRKKLIMLCDSVIAASTLLLAIVFLAGFQSIWLLFAVLVVRSAGTGVQTPAVNAILPQIVPREHLLRINGINSTFSSLTMFLSPAISGALLSVAPFAIALLIDVVTAVIGIGITATVPVAPYEKEICKTTASTLAELKDGFSYLRQAPFVRHLLLFQLAVLFFISPAAFLTPLMVSRTFGSEIWRLTASEMTYSLGMVLGGVLISTWGGFPQKLHTTLLAGAAYGALMLGLGAVPLFFLYLICNMLIGLTAPCYSAPITVTLQQTVAPKMQGRVFSLLQIATSCALPMGMILFGPLADFIPVQTIFLGAGALVLLTVYGFAQSGVLRSGQ